MFGSSQKHNFDYETTNYVIKGEMRDTMELHKKFYSELRVPFFKRTTYKIWKIRMAITGGMSIKD